MGNRLSRHTPAINPAISDGPESTIRAIVFALFPLIPSNFTAFSEFSTACRSFRLRAAAKSSMALKTVV